MDFKLIIDLCNILANKKENICVYTSANKVKRS